MPVLAHALPQSVGSVPLTVILSVLLGAFLAVNAVGTRRAAERIGRSTPSADTDGAALGGSTGDAVGWAIFVATVVLSVFGPTDPASNLTDVAVLTLGWGFVALSSMAVGGWWATVDPVGAVSRTLDRLAGGGGPQPDPPSERRSLIVLVVLLYGWAHLQLLTNLTPLAFTIVVLLYVVGHAVVVGAIGPAWLYRAEPVTVMSRCLGMMRPAGRGPLARLSTVPDSDTVRWVAGMLIGWSLVDLLLETEAWHDLAASAPTGSWLGPVVLAAGMFGIALLVRAVSSRDGLGPAFIAVAAGWVVSHYLSILLIDGQGVPIWLSDPFGTGANYLGMAGQLVNPEPVPVGVITALQIVPFLAGHVLGVAVVQRRAAARVRRAAQLGPATLFARALIGALLLGGAWLQLGGL